VSLTIPLWPPAAVLDISDVVIIHKKVVESGLHNYEGVQIPVPTKMNRPAWTKLLQDHRYPDQQLVDFIHYGWPINFKNTIRLKSSVNNNHRSALSQPEAVERFIHTELSAGATLGPFKVNPLCSALCLSPLQTVTSPDKIRVVLDLSFPEGHSVNDGIPKETFLGSPTELHYPSVETLASMVQEKGPGCLLYKRDLSRAYRQIYTCPSQWNLTAYAWKGDIFIDIVEVFGLRSAAYACQRTTSVIPFLMGTQNFSCTNYLDDFGGAEVPERAQQAFDTLGSLLQTLGLQENRGKAEPPATSMIFLGILLDTTTMSLTIPIAKLQEVRLLLQTWLARSHATLRQLQSLLGSLQHICCCVRPGRVFLNRMLACLRDLAAAGLTRFSPNTEFCKDVAWWHNCVCDFNGVSMMPGLAWHAPDTVFSTDACPTGAGGFCDGRFYHTRFPSKFQGLHIQGLEMLALIIGLKLWAPLWAGKRLLVYCDNQTVVTAMTSGYARDPCLQAGLRELCYICTMHSVDLQPRHLSSADNRISDHLSRWHLSPRHSESFYAIASQRGCTLQEESVTEDMFNFVHNW